ncbi:MAG: zinc-binding dehydrogenase [Actinobacteria bacterium]|nr:zinc-binding dehydrogenase [Actinomycetota bacterium]
MRALFFNADAPHRLEFGVAPQPVPRPHEVIVDNVAVSLNFGEVAFHTPGPGPRTVLGWDSAGVVSRAAADGTGPPVGARVVTFGWQGGWAERRAVATNDLAVVPASLDLGATSALPVAGVTALQALRRLGPVAGRRVLVTGASGGVGRFAVQLGARAGAHVIASVGSEARGRGLTQLGAAEVIVDVEDLSTPVFGLLDTVGGPQLATLLGKLEPGGIVQWIGRASRESLILEVPRIEQHAPWRLEHFTVTTPFGPDLETLIALLAADDLDSNIGWRGPWDSAADAAEALIDRKVNGKAVLDIARAI